jgi:hypothetical protein
VALLVCPVARADEGAREDRAEAQRLALLAEPAELVGVHPAVDRRVLGTRLQVLADRHDVDSVCAKVAQRLDDFVVRLPQADDDPRLRQHLVVGELLGTLEQPERLVVARLRAAHLAVKPADGLDVVVEDVGPLGEDRHERLFLDAEEVRCEDLDRGCRDGAPERANRRGVVACAPVGDVVAVDGRDDDVLEAHLLRGLRKAQRLERIWRRLGAARVHVAVATRARARLAQDLERRGATTPALGDVRAARLLADRVQARAVDQLLDVEVAPVRARRADLHPLRPAGPLCDGQRFHACTLESGRVDISG